jgi:uncharacterized DUF497 family protein
MHVLGFDWDKSNLSKLDMHGLIADDVEELFVDGDPYVIRHPTNPDRNVALGHIPDGRFVLVVFEYNVDIKWIRVITAYEPTSEHWWKIYDKAKNKQKHKY